VSIYSLPVHMIRPTQIHYGYDKSESVQTFHLSSLYFRIFLESCQSWSYQYVLSNFFCMVPLLIKGTFILVIYYTFVCLWFI